MESKNNIFKKMPKLSLKPLLIGSALTISVIGYIFYINSENEAEGDTPTQRSLIKGSYLDFKDDSLQQTQLTNKTKEIAAYIDKENYIKTVKSGKSEIMKRKHNPEMVAFQPKEKLKVISMPTEEIRDAKVKVDKVIKTEPIKILEKTENKQEEAQDNIPEYQRPDYSSLNRYAINLYKNRMFEIKLKRVSIEKPEYNPTVFSYQKEWITAQRNQKANLGKSETSKNVENYQNRGNKENYDYVPLNNVVDDNSYYNLPQTSNILFRAGERIVALTNIKASNIQLGPILVTLTEGKYAGSELMGVVSPGNDVLNFSFNTMWIPKLQIRVPINAIALSYKEETIGTATDVDNRNFRRFILQPALQGVGAAGSYYANESGTTITNNAGVVTETTAEKTANVARKVAMGAFANALNKQIDGLDINQIVTQDKNTPIFVMFLEDVHLPNSLKETQTNSFTVKLHKISKKDTKKMGKLNDLQLTREQALSLVGTPEAEHPEIKTAIEKVLKVK